MVGAYRSSPAPVQEHFYFVLKHAARDLERFVVPRVSRAAQAQADEDGIGALRHYHWLDQTGAMKDPERAIYHWEHVVPAADIVKALLALEAPTVAQIAEILKTAQIAWILKHEDRKLVPSNRPDPEAIYRAAGIELMP
ncbi:hypothetical protein SLNSH_06050 [Alsobacter soli]|uniref:Uncharacterized protein n=1 Tax=Alsobacter soli TaxID=2109933 RepID=A0A2T1HW80_9HYPH|nr:hypothetical protein [Alsobacter soli]PSC05937.1 hypothetical protein SLNSH_06050 [Alsobacter soli]